MASMLYYFGKIHSFKHQYLSKKLYEKLFMVLEYFIKQYDQN
jgi:hypothetical protein